MSASSIIRLAAGVALFSAVWAAASRAEAGWGFVVVPPPVVLGAPGYYYPPPAYYPPPYAYAPPPAQTPIPPASQPHAPQSKPTAYGGTCYAGFYVCPTPGAAPVGSDCSCPGIGAPSFGKVN